MGNYYVNQNLMNPGATITVLMVGPSGAGKTKFLERISKLSQYPNPPPSARFVQPWHPTCTPTSYYIDLPITTYQMFEADTHHKVDENAPLI
ncbi:hypothetical protein MKZ38_010538 [Zalerion maritima]|uniref:Uncharacterized protein n=1 Tax=Zalerion maritima TaxID=339359 RepID=A0AAD5RT30_9PEZI|nr:hypothetical protein MKZ38_010538 [Zalerion maritima]